MTKKHIVDQIIIGGDEDYIRYTNRTMIYDYWLANKGEWNDTGNTADGYEGEVPITSFGFICEWSS